MPLAIYWEFFLSPIKFKTSIYPLPQKQKR